MQNFPKHPEKFLLSWLQNDTYKADTSSFVIKITNIGRRALFSYRARYVTSMSFQTTVQKNQAKLSSFVQFVNEMTSYVRFSAAEQITTSYVLTVLEHSHIQSDVIACTVL